MNYHPPLHALIIAALCLTACHNSGGTTTPSASLQLTASGGTMRINEGPLSGFSIEFPLHAVSQDVTVRVHVGAVTELDGFVAASEAITFSPAGLELRRAATITIPSKFSYTANTRFMSKIVRRDSVGTVREAYRDSNLEDWKILTLDTCWRVDAHQSMDFPLSDFLPLEIGDSYEYEHNYVFRVDDLRQDPRFVGHEAIGLLRQQAGRFLSIYASETHGTFLEKSSSGEVLGLGQWANKLPIRGSVPQPSGIVTDWLAEAPYLLLPARATMLDISSELATLSDRAFEYRLETDPSTVHQGHSLVLAKPRTHLVTPMGVFPDVLPIEIHTSVAGRTAVDRFYLAWRVGIVHNEIGQGILSGTVGGVALEMR